MAKRKAIPKRVRFEVFKRDGFTCIYCGGNPPQVKLQIDHVEAVANGGTNDPENLVTACQACNSGKSAIPLDKTAKAHLNTERLRMLRESDDVLAAYNEYLKERAARRQVFVDEFLQSWRDRSNGWGFAGPCISSVERFWESLPELKIADAMDISFRTLRQPEYDPEWGKDSDEMRRERAQQESRFRYFCGVCWRMIKRAEGEDV